jgi:hypothetical protein
MFVRNPGYEFLVRLIMLQQVCFGSAKSKILKIVCAPTGDRYLMVNVRSHEVQYRIGIKTAAILILEQLLPN